MGRQREEGGILVNLDSKGAALQVSAMEVRNCLLCIFFGCEAYCAIALQTASVWLSALPSGGHLYL